MPRSPARARGLQVHVRRQSGDGVVGAQLLLPLRQRRRRLGLSGRRQARGQTVQGRPRLGEGHPAKDDHALLFVIRARRERIRGNKINEFTTSALLRIVKKKLHG